MKLLKILIEDLQVGKLAWKAISERKEFGSENEVSKCNE